MCLSQWQFYVFRLRLSGYISIILFIISTRSSRVIDWPHTLRICRTLYATVGATFAVIPLHLTYMTPLVVLYIIVVMVSYLKVSTRLISVLVCSDRRLNYVKLLLPWVYRTGCLPALSQLAFQLVRQFRSVTHLLLVHIWSPVIEFLMLKTEFQFG